MDAVAIDNLDRTRSSGYVVPVQVDEQDEQDRTDEMEGWRDGSG